MYRGVPEADYDQPAATTHILIGGAGNDEMHDIQAVDRSKDPSPHDKLLAQGSGHWTAVTDGDDHVGIGKVTIIDDSHLKFEYIRTLSGEVFDSIELVKDHTAMGAKKVVVTKK